MATTTPSLPPPGRFHKGWATLIVVAILIALTWTMTSVFSSGSKPPTEVYTSNYNARKTCPLPEPKAVDASIHNPLGIKFNLYVATELNGKDSWVPAQDGGTFARFETREDCIAAGKHLLSSHTTIYSGKTVEWAMRKWSYGGYGADVAEGTGIKPDDIVTDLSAEQLDALIKAIAKRENTGGPVATALLYVNPNDHLTDRNVDLFSVPLMEGCWTDWVRVPRYWNTWRYDEFASDEAGQYVAFWFFGWNDPKGPFILSNMPDWLHPPDAGGGRPKWRLQGKGELIYRQLS